MRNEINDVKKMASNIQGWLTDNEGELLYNLAKSCASDGCIVEIGSWKGRSTIWLAMGSKRGCGVKVYAIDPHIGSSEHTKEGARVYTFDEFMKNIKGAGCDDAIVPIVKSSEAASKSFDKPVGLVFIDGAHEYEPAKMDFELWFPKVVEGGIIALHDTIIWNGPRKVAQEKIFKSSNIKNVGFVDSISYGVKVSKIFFSDRIRNRYVLMLKKIYETARKITWLEPAKKFGKKAVRVLQGR